MDHGELWDVVVDLSFLLASLDEICDVVIGERSERNKAILTYTKKVNSALK